MKSRFHLALLLLLGCMPRPMAAEILDRVVAVVDGRPILASEWDEAIRYECFLNQCALGELTAASRQATLQRVVDQRLIEQEMRAEEARAASAGEVTRKLAELKTQILRSSTSAPSAEGWSAALERYDFTQDEIEDHLTRELSVLNFVDQRFRPTIQIDAVQVERYYNETLMPELLKAGAADPPLADVSAQIRELLTQKAIDEQLNLWLQSLRKQGRIQMK